MLVRKHVKRLHRVQLFYQPFLHCSTPLTRLQCSMITFLCSTEERLSSKCFYNKDQLIDNALYDRFTGPKSNFLIQNSHHLCIVQRPGIASIENETRNYSLLTPFKNGKKVLNVFLHFLVSFDHRESSINLFYMFMALNKNGKKRFYVIHFAISVLRKGTI